MSGLLEGLDQASRLLLTGWLNGLWLALAGTAATWVALRFAPRMNAATRHLIWWSVLAAIVVLTALQGPRSSAPVSSAFRTASAVLTTVAPTGRPLMPATSAPRPAAEPPAAVQLRAGWLPLAFLALWSVVCLFQLCRIAWSFRFLRELRARCRPAPAALAQRFEAWRAHGEVERPVVLLVSSEIVSPMATGFLRPAVILPEALLQRFEAADLDHVLLHELAHIRRRDDWTNLASRIAAAGLGLHPAAVWVLRRIAREREIACDDWVVSMTGAARPYAASLARLFEVCGQRRRMQLAAGMAEHRSQLGDRIETLLHRGRRFSPQASAALVTVAVVILVVAAGAAARAPRWFALTRGSSGIQQRIQQRFRSQFRPQDLRANPRMIQRQPGRIITVQNTFPAPQRTSFLAALVAAGYGNLSVDEIIALKSRGVSANFLTGISQSGWSKLTAQDLIDLASRGVQPEYLRAAREAGFRKVTVQDVVNLRMRGVRLDVVKEIHALGFGPYTPDEAIALASNGVPVSIFQALRDGGFKQAEAGEVIDAFRKGVRAESLRSASQYGTRLTLSQIVRLRQAGVI